MEEAGPELRTESLLGTRGEGLALIENKVREDQVARRNIFKKHIISVLVPFLCRNVVKNISLIVQTVFD